MIITPERLLDLARAEVERRADTQRVRCAFVTGSTVTDDPLLGGTADVDTVLICRDHPLHERELVRLSQDVHLDLYHYADRNLAAPRDLRTDPLLGPAIATGVSTYDPEHHFDWLQAGVRAHYGRPDQRMARSLNLLDQARTTRRNLDQFGTRWPQEFARAAFDAANAAASLTDKPAYGRRALLRLRRALISAERGDLFGGFVELMGLDGSAAWDLPHWLSAWAKAYDVALQQRNNRTLSEVRRDYYLRGYQALAEADQPQAVVYGLISTWPLEGSTPDNESAAAGQASWQELMDTIGLGAPEPEQHAHELEAFLDEVELYLETWGEQHGA